MSEDPFGTLSSAPRAPAVLDLDAVVTDPSAFAAIGAPLARTSLALACALLASGSPEAAFTSEAIFSALLAAATTRAAFPYPVKQKDISCA